MKNILFLISNLGCGGVQKSFINLLYAFDRKSYSIDVYLLRNTGIYMPMLPKDVNVIHYDVVDMIFDYFPISVMRLLKHSYLRLAVMRIIQFIISRFNRGYGGLLLSKMMSPIINKHYDVAIDEGGQSLLYFMIDKVAAEKKITFFHNDYSKWNFYYSVDKVYYPKVDYILTISETCINAMKSYFPNIDKQKFILMENITSVETIYKLSNERINDMPQSKLRLCTLGRLADQKGIDLAIDAAKILKDRNMEFVWVFIGDGVPKLKRRYARMVSEYNLCEQIVFLGVRTNPYPYLKQADIMIHPSRYEGKSIALDEIKILCKPVVVTNFSTVYDQFEDHINATICEMNPLSIAEAIIDLCTNESLRNSYINNLRDNIRDNTDQINILYRLIND